MPYALASPAPQRSLGEVTLPQDLQKSQANPLWGQVFGTDEQAQAQHTEPTRTTGHFPLSLQPLLQLIQKPTVGPLDDDLLRATFDRTGVLQALGIELHRILRVAITPPAVGDGPSRSRGHSYSAM